MRFTDLFIKRPVLAGVISAFILLIGLNSLLKLQVRQYPELTNTVITVTTVYPGATAELMQGFVTTPIQQSVASANGVDYITSSSSQGLSTVSAYIRLNFPPEVAITEVMSKVQEVNSQLPKEIQSPVIKKTTGEAYAILYVGFSSDHMTNAQITDFINRQVQPRLATVEGVASVEVLGGQTFAMRLWLDPQKMTARKVSSADVASALLRNNYQSAPGQTKSYYVVTNVEANTGLESVEDFENMVVKEVNQDVVRLRDIATVELDAQSYNSVVKMNGEKSVFIGVKNTPTSNPLTMVKKIRQTLEDFQVNLPPTLTYKIAYDATEFIQSSINEVTKTLLEAAFIVILVIFLFLGNLRAVLIPIVTIPLSIIGVCSFLLLLGFSINLLTLLAMVLAIGLVVDDAIVVVENVYRHLREGKTPLQAAVIGSREIAVPVLSMTITLVAVYAPIGFMGGITGALFSEFALTLAGSVVVSGVVALTLSPMMCSKILRADDAEGWFTLKVEEVLHLLSQYYRKYLKIVIRHRRGVVLGFALIVGFSGIFLKFTSSELAPQEDQGIVMGATKGPQHVNTDFMSHYTDQLIEIMKGIPEGELSFAFAGMEVPTAGFAGLILKPWDKRKRSAHAIMEEMQQKYSRVTGLNAFCFQPAPLPGNAGGLPVQFVINSLADYRIIYQVMDGLKQAALKSGMFFVVDSDLEFNNPVYKVAINRSKANQLGVSMQDIGDTLALMMGENYLNRFNLYGRSYQVIPMAPRSERLSQENIADFHVTSVSGKQVPLSTIAHIDLVSQPNQLFQFNQINSATFQALPKPWIKMGEVIEFLEAYAQKNLPAGFTYDYLSESRQYIQEGKTLYATFLLAIIIIFLVLAAQFESLRDPFVIMLSVPMSIFGALLVLFVGLTSMNIYSQIGLVTLIGLITKHGILIVEFANQLQIEQGLSKKDAIIEAATIRLRPILMTTAAMVVGLIPLVLARGAGAASRFSIGVVIVSGMLIGTFFTIFVVPSFYMILSRPKRPLVIDI